MSKCISNRVIGGGTLYKGCFQEEIRFFTWPELLACRLFAENLLENECFIIKGAQECSKYLGYGNSFRYNNAADDQTTFDRHHYGRRETTVVCIDAQQYINKSPEYEEKWLRRNLKKVRSSEFVEKKFHSFQFNEFLFLLCSWIGLCWFQAWLANSSTRCSNRHLGLWSIWWW